MNYLNVLIFSFVCGLYVLSVLRVTYLIFRAEQMSYPEFMDRVEHHSNAHYFQEHPLTPEECDPINKGNSFCEGPEPCYMSYCDDNGCLERERILVNESENLDVLDNLVTTKYDNGVTVAHVPFPLFDENYSAFSDCCNSTIRMGNNNAPKCNRCNKFCKTKII